MHNQGDKVNYKNFDGKLYTAIILYSKLDFENSFIKTDNAVGNFDYLVTYEVGNRKFIVFCQEEDLFNV